MRCFHCLVTALSLTCTDIAAQSVGSQVRGLLPRGTASAEILTMWAPPRLSELTRRLQIAAQADPEWFKQHVRRAAPGEPMPFDPKMGLTETEYRELINLSESMEMRPASVETLEVESTDVGWRFGSGTTLAPLRGLEIDTVRNEVQSTFGRLPAATPIKPGPAQRATGPWGGPQWKLESIDEWTATGTVATFAVGKHESTGHTVIYFDAKRADKGQISARESLFLRVRR
jgi:hypothetical protein